jgi:hypothetical protein
VITAHRTGGTNLAAFRFRHRRSDDLDLFTDGQVPAETLARESLDAPGDDP